MISACEDRMSNPSSTDIILKPPNNLRIDSLTETEAFLRWSDPNDYAGINKTDYFYEVEQSSDSVTFQSVKMISIDSLSGAIVGSYSATSLYYFRVRIVTPKKKSGYSTPNSARPKFPAPYDCVVDSINETSVKLSWKLNNPKSEWIMIEKSVNENYAFTLIDSVESLHAQKTVEGIYSDDTTYFFRVYARSSINISSYSNVINCNLNFQPPSHLSIVSISETNANLLWQLNNNFVNRIVIEKSVNQYSGFQAVDSITSNFTSKSIIGIYSSDTTYYFRIQAKSNYNFSSYSNIASVKLNFPQPDSLMMISTIPSSIKISWRDNSNFETGFEIERAANFYPYAHYYTAQANQTEFTDNSLDTLSQYKYRVRAITAINKSTYSSEMPVRYVQQGIVIRGKLHNGEVGATVFSPDGKLLASGSSGNEVKIWDVYSGALLKSFNHYYVETLDFSPNGQLIAAGGRGHIISIWNIQTGNLLQLPTNHEEVSGLDFSSDGEILISSNKDGTVKFWNVNSGALISEFTGHGGFVLETALSPDGNSFATGGISTDFKLWNANTFSLIHNLPGHGEGLRRIRFSQNGRFIASASIRVCFHDVSTGNLLTSPIGSTGNIVGFAISPDWSVIATANTAYKILVWNYGNSSPALTLSTSTFSAALDISPNGKMLASSGFGGAVLLWAISGGWYLAQ